MITLHRLREFMRHADLISPIRARLAPGTRVRIAEGASIAIYGNTGRITLEDTTREGDE